MFREMMGQIRLRECEMFLQKCENLTAGMPSRALETPIQPFGTKNAVIIFSDRHGVDCIKQQKKEHNHETENEEGFYPR